jgi:hypothetical protein
MEVDFALQHLHMFFAIPDDGGVHSAAGFIIGILHGLLADFQGTLGGIQRF